MKLIISFLLGVWFSWGWIEKYNGETFDLWTEAYTVGKDDGYRLGRSEASIHYDHTFQEKEAMCLFLYADKGTVFGTSRK